MTYPYTFVIDSQAEYDALYWASARWYGATVLVDLMHEPDDWDGEMFPVEVGFQEFEARQVQEAINAEDSGFIPCLCSSLNGRIQDMLGRII